MPVFTALGREWLVNLDAQKSMAVRSEHGVSLTPKLGEPFDLSAITRDPEIVPLVLWTLVRSQAPDAVSRDAFIESVVGDTAEAAGEALAEAIINFIPSRSRRETLRLALKHDREATAAADDLMLSKVQTIGKPQVAAAIRAVESGFEELTARLNPATSSPAPSESPPPA